jgi:hypothetical protein
MTLDLLTLSAVATQVDGCKFKLVNSPAVNIRNLLQ